MAERTDSKQEYSSKFPPCRSTVVQYEAYNSISGVCPKDKADFHDICLEQSPQGCLDVQGGSLATERSRARRYPLLHLLLVNNSRVFAVFP